MENSRRAPWHLPRGVCAACPPGGRCLPTAGRPLGRGAPSSRTGPDEKAGAEHLFRTIKYERRSLGYAPFFLAAAKYAVLARCFTGIQEKQDDETSRENPPPNRAHPSGAGRSPGPAHPHLGTSGAGRLPASDGHARSPRRRPQLDLPAPGRRPPHHRHRQQRRRHR